MAASTFIPVTGATIQFDEHTVINGNGLPFLTLRRLHFPGGLLNPPRRLQQFFRDEYTLGSIQFLLRSTFEIEYFEEPLTFSEHAAYLRVFIQLLMMRANCRLAAPCYATHSLTTIDTLEPKEIAIKMFAPDDAHFRHRAPVVIAKEDVDWVAQHLDSFVFRIQNQERALLAFHALSSERFAHSNTMSLLTLWSGLEALFSVEHEQTFRISLMVAYYLETIPAEREQLFKEMREAYGIRSAVTHGRKQKPEIIDGSVEFVGAILRRCMLRLIDSDDLPSTKSLFFA